MKKQMEANYVGKGFYSRECANRIRFYACAKSSVSQTF